MTRPKIPIAIQLEAARAAIENTLAVAELAALVAVLGYDGQRLREGVALCGKPQLLEKLGIITPAAWPSARKPAPTPQAA